MAKILVVDDDPEIHLLTGLMLKKEGHHLLAARDGLEGLEVFRRDRPHLVLMDVMMPGMDGYETTRHLKGMSGEGDLVPVIFLTGVENNRELARCLDCGGDDFVTKPVNGMILRARVRAWLRKVELAEKLFFERESIEEVILKMRRTPHFDPRGIRSLVTPVERTAGDFLFSASRPDGVQHLMLGDFTGHGLPAAIGGPLVSNIFYSMTLKGFEPRAILEEINLKVHEQVPSSMFLAACFIEVDRQGGRARVWNGGMPEMLWFQGARLRERIPSRHLALGIRAANRIAETLVPLTVGPGSRIIACSDGIVEAMNPAGELFGQEAVEVLLGQILERGEPLEALQYALEAHREHQAQSDDITLVEVSCF